MNSKGKITAGAATAMAVVLAVTGVTVAANVDKRDVSQKTSEAAIVTNDNGSVTRSFSECTITTNGSLVTEHRRETHTTLDTEGNLLASSTSEYDQSYSVDDVPSPAALRVAGDKGAGKEPPAASADAFLGLKFGEAFDGTNLVCDADEPTLLRATFTPKKTLAGFDDYYVYVTPKTHKVVKVYACAKKAIEPGARWRRHYLIEALEKRYQTWARLCSYSRPCYAFDLGSGRYVTACLAQSSRDYETVIVAWDDTLLTLAADETEAIRAEARKAAAEKRSLRVKAAADAF